MIAKSFASEEVTSTTTLKTADRHIGSCQVCAEAKNLVKVEIRQKRAAGATKDFKGKLVEFSFWMLKEGYAESTIKSRTRLIQIMANRRADLYNPEEMKGFIATQKTWSQGTKSIAVAVYTSFLEMLGETWDPPRYKVPESIPFIPLESEIDALINSCGRKTACFLQGLKDTGADPGELARLEWTDINRKAKSVTIRHPVKGHSPRVVPVSDAFLGRLNVMRKARSRVFCSAKSLRSTFSNQRKNTVRKTGNARILKISFRTFRHWKGTMEYHKTKDILHVKRILGHKCIKNTMVYINLEAAIFDETNEEFTVRVAKTLDEACNLIEAGFDYVTDMDGQKLFRRRK